MPASQTRRDWRGRWLPVLFWTGVGLALPAMLMLLLGQGGGSLRLAAVLAMVCVLLIGFSVALRNDARAIRAQVEAMVLNEIDGVREENREDIVAVARKLHSTLREEAADLADQIEELRSGRAVAAARTSQDAAGFGRGLVRAETAPQWRQSPVAADESGHRSNGTARSATAAAPVSGLPQRSVPAWSEVSGWRDYATQPAASGRATIQPPSPRAGSHDDYPGTTATSRWDPLTGSLNGAHGDWAGRSAGAPASPVSPGPVSSNPISPGPVSGGPVSPGPVPTGPISAVPATDWRSPNGNGTTYSRYSGGGGYPDHAGHPTGHGYPNGGNHSNGSTYPNGTAHPNGNAYPNGSTYRSGDLNGGRRRVPEPDAPPPRAAIESAGRTVDPWADLRGDTGTSGSYHSGGPRSQEYGQAGHHNYGSNYGSAAAGSGGYRQPAPDPDWPDRYR